MDLTKLVVHVERMVLNGFQPWDREVLSDSLRRELVRRLGAGDAARQIAQLSDAARLDLARLHIPRALDPEDMGAWIARVIARGLRS